MKNIYLGLLILVVNSGKAQNIAFEQVAPDLTSPQNTTYFYGIKDGSIAFADIDNDKDQDVLISGLGCYAPGCTKLYANNGNGNYTEVTGTPLVSAREGSVAFADIDNDNDQDVLITGLTWIYPNYSILYTITKLYKNDGSGNYTEVTGTPFTPVSHSSIAFADIDNDNDLDVLITGLGTQSPISKLYKNDGTGNFTEVIGTSFDAVHYSSIAFADVDNDQDQDVLITGEKGFSPNDSCITKLYTNDGSGNFAEMMGTPFEKVERGSIAFKDIDNDNDQDVLITGEGIAFQRIAKLYTNDGNGNYTEVVGTPFDRVSLSSIAFADIDNDNDQDVLITGGKNNAPDHCIAKLYTNDGNGNYTEVTGIPFDGVEYSAIAFADIDNDSDQDVLITGKNNLSGDQRTAKLYKNITTTSVSENAIMNQILIYPIPNKGVVNIDLGELKDASLKVFNVKGQLVFQKEKINIPIYQLDLNEAPGVYFIEVSTAYGKQEFKFIKE